MRKSYKKHLGAGIAVMITTFFLLVVYVGAGLEISRLIKEKESLKSQIRLNIDENVALTARYQYLCLEEFIVPKAMAIGLTLPEEKPSEIRIQKREIERLEQVLNGKK
mgnify:FL=1